MKLLRISATALIGALIVVACSSNTAEPDKPREIVLLAYDSFVLSKGVIEGFTKSTGIAVKVVTQGDAGELINSAILTKGSPESGVLWGVDSTFLGRAIKEQIFSPYTSKLADDLDPALRALVPKNEVTPVDRGDVLHARLVQPCQPGRGVWLARIA